MSSAPEPSLAEKIAAVHRCLEDAQVPHAFGGALAVAYYAEPRATDDVDLNIFAPTQRFEEIADSLAPLGVDTGIDRAQLDRDGQCRLWWGRTPLDLFFAYDEIHGEMERDARLVPFGSQTLPILSPEHLLVCKATLDRSKDWIDIEQMVVVVEDLDVDAIDRWLARIVGEDDGRRQRFDELVERYRNRG